MISNLVSFCISYKLQRTALEVFQSSNGDLWPVFDGDKFTGMVSRSDLGRAVREGVVSIRPISNEHHFPHVHSDHTLDVVLHRMGSTGMKVLPVVSRSDIQRLEGIITLDDVLRVYGLQDEGGLNTPPREGLARRGGCGINKKPRSHRSVADGVVAHKPWFKNTFPK